MVEIIPTILVKDFPEALARIRAVEGVVDWMQVDVVDGKFAPNVTWGDPQVLAGLDTKMRFEIDLMVVDSEEAVRQWLKASPRVGRIYFHQETVSQKSSSRSAGRAHHIITKIKEAGAEAGMSLNPDTPTETLFSFVPRLDAVLFLGVDPGFNASPFHEDVIKKVRSFHEKFPKVSITVDGGVRPGTARRLAEAGAVRLAAGSFIFGSDTTSPREQIEALRKDVQGIRDMG